MEQRKAKPTSTKSQVRRSVSNSVARVASPSNSAKPTSASSQKSSIPNSKKSVAAAQKQSLPTVTKSFLSSEAQKEMERLDEMTIANASFSVLVQVLVAARKWRKMIKGTAGKTPLTKSMSLPPGIIRPA